MKKLCIILGVTAALLLAFTFFVDRDNRRLKDEVSSLRHDLAHATIPLQRDTIRDSIPVVTQKVITVDKTDYKQMAADKQLIKDLNLKLNQVESENRMLLATHGQAQLKPSAESDSILRYHDHWADFTYYVKPQQLQYAVRDSLTTIVSRIYKHRFLWWRWGTKGYEVRHVSHNPNCSIEYNQYIKVEH